MGAVSGRAYRNVDLTYRQIDYWCRTGAIVPSGGGCMPGSGRRRHWSIRDLQRLQAIARFQRIAKHFARDVPTDVIAAIWRGLAETDTFEMGGDGASITIELRPAEWFDGREVA